MHDYEAKLEAFYKRCLQPGDTAIDVGAHLGRHTLPMARSAGTRGRIFAFEPLPSIRDSLIKRVEEQTLRDPAVAPIRIYPFALSDHSGIEDFVSVKELPEYSGLRERTYDSPVSRERINVDVRRLDSMALPLVGLRYIKVDAEGGDYQVLRGAEKVLAEYRPLLSFEFGDNGIVNYPHTAGDMFDYLDSLSYAIYDIRGQLHDRYSFVESSSIQVIWDYIASAKSDQHLVRTALRD